MFIRSIVCSDDFNRLPAPTNSNLSGVMTWNYFAEKIVIHNGENFQDVYPQTIHISLTDENSNALKWAKMKMQEEKELNELCAKHPGLKDAKDAFDTMYLLCKANK